MRIFRRCSRPKPSLAWAASSDQCRTIDHKGFTNLIATELMHELDGAIDDRRPRAASDRRRSVEVVETISKRAA
jgi:hypothetical protein